ncbi:MAG: hypothetical protein WBM17_17555 [Anaerolineales bacterium]
MNNITSFLHSSLGQTILTGLLAVAIGYIAFTLVTSLRFEKSSTRRLRQAAGVDKRGLDNELGDTLLRFLKLDTKQYVAMLDWAQLSGEAEGWTTGTLIGRMVLYGAAVLGLIFIVTRGENTMLLLIAPFAGLVPLFNLQGWAEKARKIAKSEVPETAALLAAELAAGGSPMVALQRTSTLPGILSKLIRRAFEISNTTNAPLFSTASTKGTLVQVMLNTKVSVLTALGAQMDLVARKGGESADLMTDIGKNISLEYYEEQAAAAEALDSALLIPSAIFYFLPLIAVLMLPLSQMLGAAF